MKKRWTFFLLLSLSVLLVGCQPKEDPKELALIGFDNMLKQDGFEVKSNVDFKADISKLPADDKYEKFVTKNLSGFSLKYDASVDMKQKKVEQSADLTVPVGKNKASFSLNMLVDEGKNEVYLDNGKLVASAKSIWKVITDSKLLSEDNFFSADDIKTVDRILVFLDETFTGSFTQLTEEADNVYLEGFTEDLKGRLAELRPAIEAIPAEMFAYEKDKKGAYGHILVSLPSKDVDSVMKAALKNEFDKRIKDEKSEDGKAYLKEQHESLLEEWKVLQERVKIEKLELRILVDDDKRIVGLSSHLKLDAKHSEGEDTVTVPIDFKTDTEFSRFGKPRFDLPKKDVDFFNSAELSAIFNDKYMEWVENYYSEDELE